MKYAEEEAELIKQEAAIKASRAVLTCKKELEAAKQGLDAVRKFWIFWMSKKVFSVNMKVNMIKSTLILQSVM